MTTNERDNLYLKAIAERRRANLLISGINPDTFPRTQMVSESKALREDLVQLEIRLRAELEDFKRDDNPPIPLASLQPVIDLTKDNSAKPRVRELNITTGQSKISQKERDILKKEKRMDDETFRDVSRESVDKDVEFLNRYQQKETDLIDKYKEEDWFKQTFYTKFKN